MTVPQRRKTPGKTTKNHKRRDFSIRFRGVGRNVGCRGCEYCSPREKAKNYEKAFATANANAY